MKTVDVSFKGKAVDLVISNLLFTEGVRLMEGD